MSDGWAVWLSYRASDFLMFSPRIYWRLFESMNRALWPAQPLIVAAALAWLLWGTRHVRAALAGLGASWLLVAWVFLLLHFAPINWPASGYAVAFALQGLGLLALAAHGGAVEQTARRCRRVGTGLLCWALLGQPLLAWALGRPWQQAEVFGLAPDPTAIGTLALLRLLQGRTATARAALRLLWAVPLGWCAISALTLWTLGSAQAVVPLVAAGLALAARPDR